MEPQVYIYVTGCPLGEHLQRDITIYIYIIYIYIIYIYIERERERERGGSVSRLAMPEPSMS